MYMSGKQVSREAAKGAKQAKPAPNKEEDSNGHEKTQSTQN